jgi:hypothetical protein
LIARITRSVDYFIAADTRRVDILLIALIPRAVSNAV